MNKKLNVNEIESLVDNYIDNEAMTDREIKISTAGQIIWLDKEHAQKRAKSISNGRKGTKFTELHRKNIGIAGLGRIPHNKGKITPEEVIEKQRKAHAGAIAHNKKPVMTPSGAFESAMAAGSWGKQQNISNAYRGLQHYIYNNIDPDRFRYITQEEFNSIKDFPWQDPNHIPNWFPGKRPYYKK
jgi:hypothetical protein